MSVCRNCGAENPKDAFFCTNCGIKLETMNHVQHDGEATQWDSRKEDNREEDNRKEDNREEGSRKEDSREENNRKEDNRKEDSREENNRKEDSQREASWNCGENNTEEAPRNEATNDQEKEPDDFVDRGREGFYVNPEADQARNHAIVSMILGIISVTLWLFGITAILSIVAGIIGLIFSAKAKRAGDSSGFRTAGFILSLIGIICGCLGFVACACIGCTACTAIL